MLKVKIKKYYLSDFFVTFDNRYLAFLKMMNIIMRKHLQLLLLLVLLSSINIISNSQSTKPTLVRVKLVAVIDSILKSQVNLVKIPGAVIEIKMGTRIIYKQAYGYADKSEKMTVSHLFDIASLTKVIGTTSSVMLLVDRGLVNIEDPVCKYIKAFETPEKKTITILNLLTHTAGL